MIKNIIASTGFSNLSKASILVFVSIILMSGMASAQVDAADNSYESIQTAIDAIDDGDIEASELTVNERESGTYDAFTVDVSGLTVKAADGENPVIEADNTDVNPVVDIESSGVTFQGFTVRGQGTTSDLSHEGIHIDADNAVVRDNEITNLDQGIFVPSDSNIFSNTITDSSVGIGTSGGSDGANISFNTVDGATLQGISLWKGENLVVEANDINLDDTTVGTGRLTAAGFDFTDDTGTGSYAMNLASGASGTIKDNDLDSTDQGILIQNAGASTTFENNEIDGERYDVRTNDTVQMGLKAIESGDLLRIYPDTYEESVTVETSQITIEGPNAGVSGDGDRAQEARITEGVEISADGITLDGLEITNDGTNGVKISNAPSDVTVTNSRIVDVSGAVGGKAAGNGINLQFTEAFEKTSTGIEITNNLIKGVSTPGNSKEDSDAIGIQLLPRGNDVENLRIANNVIKDIDPSDGSGRSEARGISIDTQFTDTPNGERGDSGQPTGLEVENNEIRNLEADFGRAIALFEDKEGDTETNNAIGPVNFEIRENTINNVNSVDEGLPSLAVFVGGYETLGTDHLIERNKFYAGVENFGDISNQLNAQRNFWMKKPGEMTLGDVAFEPWYVTSDFSEDVELKDSSENTVAYSGSIQSAADAVGENQRVEVGEGEFEENLDISQSVNISGAGAGETVLSPGSGDVVELTGNQEDIGTVKITDLRVETKDASIGLQSNSDGDTGYDVENLVYKNLVVDQNGNAESAIGIFDVKNALLDNVTVRNSTREDGGAIEVIGADDLEIRDSEIRDNDIGFKIFDWKVGELYASNGNVRIRNTDFAGNSMAVKNGGDSLTVDAKQNYWGAASGPSGEGSGTGDSVSKNVDYKPWLLEEDGEFYEETIGLEDGWSVVSVPGQVENAELVSGQAFEFDASSQVWDSVSFQNLDTTQAVAVTPEAKAVGFNYTEETTGSTSLQEGWNLVSLPESEGSNQFQNVLSTAQNPMESFAYPSENEEKSHGYDSIQTGLINANNIFNNQQTLSGEVVSALDGYWVDVSETTTLDFSAPNPEEAE